MQGGSRKWGCFWGVRIIRIIVFRGVKGVHNFGKLPRKAVAFEEFGGTSTKCLQSEEVGHAFGNEKAPASCSWMVDWYNMEVCIKLQLCHSSP